MDRALTPPEGGVDAAAGAAGNPAR